MPEIKLTQRQYELLKNDPLHYNLSIMYDSRDQCYRADCDSRTAMQIKKIVDN